MRSVLPMRTQSVELKGKRLGESVSGLLAVLSALLGAASYPPFSLYPLIWIAFVPLLIAICGASIWRAAWLGALLGVVGLAVTWWWLRESISAFFALSFFFSAVLFFVFICWHALQIALFAAATAVAARTAGVILAAPAAWVAAESFFPRILPWSLAMALQPHLPFVQLAEWTGPAGPCFAVMAVNACLAGALLAARVGARVARIAAAAAIVAGLHVIGSARMAAVTAEDVALPTAVVAIAQGNLPATRDVTAAFIDDSLAVYSALTREAAGSAPAIVVWPEAALRTDFSSDWRARQTVAQLAVETRATLIIGAGAMNAADRELSSVFAMANTGDVIAAYHKVLPFPFAERLPRPFTVLASVWPRTQVEPGEGPSSLFLPGTIAAPSICYEATVPGFFAPAVRAGAQFAINLTNDVWFGDTGGPVLHLQAAVLRAIESRRWLVRAANSGISAIIDPTGRIVARAPLFTRAVLSHPVRLRTGETLYVRWREWFLAACVFFLVLVIIGTALVAIRRR